MVTIATIRTDIWNTFYSIINDNVTDPKASTRNKWIYTTFPENKVKSKGDLPILCISPVKTSWNRIGNHGTYCNFNLDIEINISSAELVDTYSDLIENAIKTNLKTLRNTNKLAFIEMDIDDEDPDNRDSYQIHRRIVTVSGVHFFRRD